MSILNRSLALEEIKESDSDLDDLFSCDIYLSVILQLNRSLFVKLSRSVEILPFLSKIEKKKNGDYQMIVAFLFRGVTFLGV